MQALPETDDRSRAILQQMHKDELHHREQAIDAGAQELPESVKAVMGVISKVMTKSSYFV
jgi:ubiquinone biosynthesis monooxygenase Coq7